MANLISIPGIGKSSLELLEAAGFSSMESLARVGVDELFNELERANNILKIAKRPPTKKSVNSWIDQARALTGMKDEPEAPPLMPVNYERIPQVVSMLANAPFAIPLPVRVLVENNFRVKITIPIRGGTVKEKHLNPRRGAVARGGIISIIEPFAVLCIQGNSVISQATPAEICRLKITRCLIES